MTPNQHSVDRLLTTHVGSLPRPTALLDMMAARHHGDAPPHDADYDAALRDAVADCVARQVRVGIDVVGDGEMSKPGFFAYAQARMAGIEAAGEEPTMSAHAREIAAFPEYYEDYFQRAMLGGTAVPVQTAVCTGPIEYVGTAELARDLANLADAARATPAFGAFVPSVAPSGLANDRYYPSEEAFWEAAGEALRTEYQAIVAAGFLLQIDDPFALSFFADLDGDRGVQTRRAEAYVEILNHTLRGISPESLRYHVCYSINEGPRVFDVPFERFVPVMLTVNAAAYTFEAGNPRHEHEYHIWEDVSLPDGRVLLPGVIAHASNIVEHPEVIAERLVRFGERVGRENVVASVDCGFSSQATYRTEVHPTVVWAKLRALHDGARLATDRLF